MPDSCKICMDLHHSPSAAVADWEDDFNVPLCIYHRDYARLVNALIGVVRGKAAPQERPERRVLTDSVLAQREREIDFNRAMMGNSAPEEEQETADHFRYRERQRWTPEPSKTSPSESQPDALASELEQTYQNLKRMSREEAQVELGRVLRNLPSTEAESTKPSSTRSRPATKPLSLKGRTTRGAKSVTTS